MFSSLFFLKEKMVSEMLLLAVIILEFFLVGFDKLVSAGDPDMLQDLCVADLNSRKG